MSLQNILMAARANRDAFVEKRAEYNRIVQSAPPVVGAKPGEGFRLVLPVEEFGRIYQARYNPQSPLAEQNKALEEAALKGGVPFERYADLWSEFAGQLEALPHTIPRLTQNARKKYDELQQKFGADVPGILDMDERMAHAFFSPLDGLGPTSRLAVDILNYNGEKIRPKNSECDPEKLLNYIQQSDMEGQLGALRWLLTCEHDNLKKTAIKAMFEGKSIYSLEQVEEVLQAVQLPLEPLACSIAEALGPKELRFGPDQMCTQPYTDQLIATLEYVRSLTEGIETISEFDDHKNPGYLPAMACARKLTIEFDILQNARLKLMQDNILEDYGQELLKTVRELKGSVHEDTPPELRLKAENAQTAHQRFEEKVDQCRKILRVEPLFGTSSIDDALLGLQTLSPLHEEHQTQKEWDRAAELVEKIFGAKDNEKTQEAVRDWISGLDNDRKAMFVKPLLEARYKTDVLHGMKLLSGLPAELQKEKDWEKAAARAEELLGLKNFDEIKTSVLEWILGLEDEKKSMFVAAMFNVSTWDGILLGMKTLGALPKNLQWEKDWEKAAEWAEELFSRKNADEFKDSAREWILGLEDERKTMFITAMFNASTWDDILLGMRTLEALPKDYQREKDWGAAAKWVEKIFDRKDDENIRESVRPWILGLADHHKTWFIKPLLKARYRKDTLLGLQMLGRLPEQYQREKDWETAVNWAERVFERKDVEIREAALTCILRFTDRDKARFVLPLLKSKFWDDTISGMQMLGRLPDEYQTKEQWEKAAKEAEKLAQGEKLLEQKKTVKAWIAGLDTEHQKLFFESVKSL